MNTKINVSAEHKILVMNADKRGRVLNAAMKEFAKGYKNASTDVIVREAGISKGLLFHYFNTKKELFIYAHKWAQKIVLVEYINLININQRDILERWRQIVMLKIDLIHKYPALFAFITSTSPEENDEAISEINKRKEEFSNEVYTKLFRDIDFSLFRGDINVHKAMDVIAYTMESYANSEGSPDKARAEYELEYHRYIKEVEEYIRLFRKSFYK